VPIAFPRLRGLALKSLKPKLVVGFLVLSLLIGVSGAIGLFFVQRIGATVAFFSDVTSPLLTLSMKLGDNAQRTRAAFLDGLSRGQDADTMAKELARLDEAARQQLEELRALSTKAGITARVDEAAARQRELNQILQDMLAAHFRGRATDAATQERLAKFETERRAFDAQLAALAAQAETRMAESEDKAKIQVQTGTATIEWLGELFSQTMNETLPVLQGVYKLMRDSVKVQDLAKTYAHQRNASALPALEQDTKAAAKAAATATRKFGGRMRTADGKAQIAAILQSITQLETTLVGDDGAFAAHRKNLEARGRLAELTQKLGRVENAYLAVLTEVEQAVQTLND
jgi:hypothetical protein